MSNIYIPKYTNQSARGWDDFPQPVYRGYKYQKGGGFFGNLWNIIKPIGKYFGKQILSTGVSVGKDILNGENVKESALRGLKNAKKTVLSDAADRLKTYAQTGEGRRRKRRRRTKPKQNNRKKAEKRKNKNKINIKPKKVKKNTKKKRKSVKKSKPKKKGLRHIF